MHTFYGVLKLIAFCAVALSMVPTEKIKYWSIERPTLTYYNTKYGTDVNVTCRRLSRADPYHYLSIHFVALDYFANNITVHVYFYEFLSNTYKRGFIEIHGKLCDFMKSYSFVAATFRNTAIYQPCPHPPGPYHLENMTLPTSFTPRGFPFSKGRIYVNVTLLPSLSLTQTDELIAAGYIDLEIKEMRKRSLK